MERSTGIRPIEGPRSPLVDLQPWGQQMADDPKEKPLGVRSPEPGPEVAREATERRRVAEIAHEIEELGRALDERDRLARSDTKKKPEGMSGVDEVSSRVEQLAAMPAIPQQRKLMAEDGRLAGRRKLWSSLAVALIAFSLASAGALVPMGAWIETAQNAYRSAVAQTQRLSVRQDGGTETAAPEAPQQSAMAEEAEQKAAEEKLAAAVAARRRDQDTRRATEEKARAEAARDAAQARAAAQETERKAAEEERAAAVAARRREEENRQATEEKARAEAAREIAQARVVDPPRKAIEEQSRSDAEVRKQAERAEVALKLSEQDRKRVQVALNALGHTMPSATGHFGPRTRAMITSWQKTQGLSETGYLTEAQLATLLQQAAAALAKYDQAQRKVNENPPGTE